MTRTPRPRLWITGAGGLIGSALARAARAIPDWEVVPLARENLELCDPKAIRELLRDSPPSAIIHCAAISRNPLCDANPELARRVNTEATRILALESAPARFLFFSTDLVFDGRKGEYLETDPVGPLSAYAETKVEAEKALAHHPNCLVLRTSLNAGGPGCPHKSFDHELIAAWREGRPTKLFTDEHRCPIPVSETARATLALLSLPTTGILHLAGPERLSRLEIGRVLAERHPDLRPQIIPSLRADHPGPTRPPDTSLNCDKAARLLGWRPPRFTDWVRTEFR